MPGVKYCLQHVLTQIQLRPVGNHSSFLIEVTVSDAAAVMERNLFTEKYHHGRSMCSFISIFEVTVIGASVKKNIRCDEFEIGYRFKSAISFEVSDFCNAHLNKN